MLSYKEWRHLSEDVSSNDINKIIDDTVAEIEQAVNDFISRVPVAQVAPQQQQKQGLGSRIKSGITNYLNQPTAGALSQAEKDAGKRFTRGEKMSSMWNNMKNRVKSFFMKKEWEEFVEEFSSTRYLQSVLVECGVSRLVLSEASGDFNQLRQAIRDHLQNLSGKIQNLFQTKPAQQAPGQTVSNRPSSFDKPAPTQATAPQDKDYIDLALKSDGSVKDFAAKAGEDAVATMSGLKAQLLKISPDKKNSIQSSLVRGMKLGYMWNSVMPEKSKLYSLLKTLRPQSQPELAQPEAPAQTSQPEPEVPNVQPTQPEIPDEPQPKKSGIEWRQPDEHEMKDIKRLSGTLDDRGVIEKLLRSRVDPKEIIEANPELRTLVLRVMSISGSKAIRKHVKQVAQSTF